MNQMKIRIEHRICWRALECVNYQLGVLSLMPRKMNEELKVIFTQLQNLPVASEQTSHRNDFWVLNCSEKEAY